MTLAMTMTTALTGGYYYLLEMVTDMVIELKIL